jgi:hypothetical protein
LSPDAYVFVFAIGTGACEQDGLCLLGEVRLQRIVWEFAAMVAGKAGQRERECLPMDVRPFGSEKVAGKYSSAMSR